MTHPVLLRHNVQILGEGPTTLLLLHGFGCDQGVWRYMVPTLVQNHRIILMDHVGHGQSDPRAFDEQRHSSLDGYTQDVLAVCEALNLTQAVLIGHSVSATIGMLASLQAPERFAHLVMLSPSPCYCNDPVSGYVGGFEPQDLEDLLLMMESNYIGWAAYLAPVVSGANNPKVGDEMNERFCALDPAVARVFARATFLSDVRRELARCTTPCLVLQCEDDALVPYSVGGYMRQTLPTAELHIVQAHGHCLQLSHPVQTLALIQDYLHAHPQGLAC